jgi:hypothetical protein
MFAIEPNSSISHILRLVLCALVSIAGFWYPLIIGHQYAEYDNRMGFVVFIALPLVGLAALFSIILLYRLFCSLKMVQARWRHIVVLVGLLTAAPSILAILYIGFWVAVSLGHLIISVFRSFLS